MKCPSCGSPVKEGRFCNYCGAKLPDDTQRIEIRNTVEDVAEIKRIERERVESERKEEERLKARSTKRKACIVLTVVLVLVSAYGAIFKPNDSIKQISAVAFFWAFGMIAFIIYQMITGKW